MVTDDDIVAAGWAFARTVGPAEATRVLTAALEVQRRLGWGAGDVVLSAMLRGVTLYDPARPDRAADEFGEDE